MRISAVFNNDVVLARDELGRETVLTGRGLGFRAHPGDPVEADRVVRRFVPVGNAATVAQVLSEIPPERLTLVTELFGAAVRSLGASLPALSVVSAADHIHRAVERVRRGERIEYPLRAEVAYLHPQELAVAERLFERLNERLDPPLPAGETSALAMHLFHACTGAAGMEKTFAHSALIRRVFDLLSHAMPGFEPDSVDAARFAAHLRYFFVRDRDGLGLAGPAPSVVAMLEEQEPAAHRLAERIRALLELRLGHSISNDEVAYLTVHLARLACDVKAASS
ncbi:PRD domain protein [Actinobaculum sp. oral taxon 183 str. F0552]|uniref:PRD domain-containing protein n=2 Tax=Actinomycetaceae TaxID=2049 RepID=UPI0003971CC9|nr:PRD domain-containing protein [Actinobaculum sp. oral taxon 183]ERH18841.1 PRD domain protein [Actinobaculum sp. oral taxon 183 str. F0552]